MKKIYAILVLLFLLTACNRISGDSHVICTDVAQGLFGIETGATTIEIYGENEDILTWKVSTELPRSWFDEVFLNGIFLSDSEIRELFQEYNKSEMEGIVVYLTEINADHVIISMIYDYGVISVDDLNIIWDVENFEENVTLSFAIAGLEEGGAMCEIRERIIVEE